LDKFDPINSALKKRLLRVDKYFIRFAKGLLSAQFYLDSLEFVAFYGAEIYKYFEKGCDTKKFDINPLIPLSIDFLVKTNPGFYKNILPVPFILL